MTSRILLLIPFLLAIPIALFLGVSASSPDSIMSIGVIGSCLGFLFLPLLLRRHEMFLLFSWNTLIFLPFLPGNLQLWMVMAAVSFTIAFVATGLNRGTATTYRYPFHITLLLLLLGMLVLFTAEYRGGIGLRIAGSEAYGGHRYFSIFFAILGFFALRQIKIPQRSVWLYVGLFFLGTILLSLSNLIYLAGPSFYWLYNVFPSSFAVDQARGDQMGGTSRMGGIAFATVGPYCYLLARYGIRGIFVLGKPLKLIIFLGLVFIAAFGGFRSLLLLFFVIFIVLAFYEGLWNARNIAIFTGMGVLLFTLVVSFSDRLPLSIQRTVSFLPVRVDAAVALNAQASIDWRFRMWESLWREVPKYLWVGKGYSFDPSDAAFLSDPTFHIGEESDFQAFIVAGDYHSGPFSVLLSFGIPGVVLVFLFWVGSLRLLYRNYKKGNAELLAINRFLLVYFIVRIIYFLTAYGDFANDLALFCGLIGLSVALNKSVLPVSSVPSVKISNDALLHNYSKL